MTDPTNMGDTESHTDSGPATEPQKTSGEVALKTRALARVGKYELLGRLRVGGMAELFRARELTGEAKVIALKRILPSFTDEADYVAMFLDEARLGLRLKHPGIVETLELGEIEGDFYIALEYVRGQDVGALLRRAREQKQPLPVPVACRIALDICEALHYAHELHDEQGVALEIVHRDVSPDNVLVSFEGEVKLIDFGIAKSTEQLMRTQAGLMKGKHGYLSPEQAAGQPLDRRSDLFSLGVCLYEMLSAERLFQGSSDFSTIVRVRKAEVPSLTMQNPLVPEELEAIVRRALAKSPDARFATAAELASALSAFVASSGESCDHVQLAAYMRASFPDNASDTGLEPDAETKADPSTGLLDAFDSVEPPSTVSTLSAFESPEPSVGSQGSALLQEVDSALLEETSDGGDDDDYEDVTDAAPEPTGQHQAHYDDGDRSGDERGDAAAEQDMRARHDETTSVVEYESTTTGDLADEDTHVSRQPEAPVHDEQSDSDAAEPALSPSEITRPRGRRPRQPEQTIPGSDLEWDDDDLSTHVYDAPVRDEDGSAPQEEPRPRSMPVPTAISRPPSAASVPSPPPPIGHGAPSPFANASNAEIRSIPPRQQSHWPSHAPAPALLRAWRQSPVAYGAAIAAAIVALVVCGLWLMREPPRATLQLTTDPPEVVVTLDGVTVGGNISPFVMTGVKPEVNHEIEVREPGYRTWRTRLVLEPGQKVDLPLVRLMKDAPLSPARAAETRPAPVARAEQPPPAPPVPSPRPNPAPPRVEPSPPPTHDATYVTHSRPSANKTPEPSGTGTLRINSRPWSQVYVDGRLVGSTPQTGLTLGAGRHTVTLVNPDFNLRKVLAIELKRGEIVTKVVALTN